MKELSGIRGGRRGAPHSGVVAICFVMVGLWTATAARADREILPSDQTTEDRDGGFENDGHHSFDPDDLDFDLPTGPDFDIVTLVYKHPTNPALDEWESVGLSPANPIESGLQVEARAVLPPGAAYVKWYKNNSYLKSGATYAFNWTGPQQFTLKARFCDVNWLTVAEVSKEVNIDSGMTLLSSMPHPGVTFRPQYYSVTGSHVWAIAENGRIGRGNLSNPAALPALELVNSLTLSEKYGIAATNGRVALARGSQGVTIHSANPASFSQVAAYSNSALGLSGVSGIATAGNIVLCAGYSNSIRPIRISTSGTPALLPMLHTPTPVGRLFSVGSSAVIGIAENGSNVVLIDVRTPDQPIVVGSFSAGKALNASACSHGNYFAINAYGGGVQSEVVVTPTGQLTIAPFQALNSTFVSGAVWGPRLFTRDGELLTKRDLLPIAGAPYAMQTVQLAAPFQAVIFVHEPSASDGPYVLAGFDFGFRAYAP